MRILKSLSPTSSSSRALFGVLFLRSLQAGECNGLDEHTFSMNSHRRRHLTLQNRAPRHLLHEIVFAVNQRNTVNLEYELLERSTPESSKYQQWMTFEEVGDFTSNVYGADMIKDWLKDSNATVTWESIHSDYIKATAPLHVWESLFDTTFYEWEDTGRKSIHSSSSKREKPANLILAKEYTIPENMRLHLFAAFNTVQPPPILSPGYHLRKDKPNTPKMSTEEMKDQSFNFYGVTVPFLNSFYKIQTNKGSSNHSQGVFETSGEKYSPNDVKQFQKTYGLTIQAPIDKKGISSTDTCQSRLNPQASYPDCFEGNLDLQYIMGISQVTNTYFWYDGSNNAFLSWITSMSNTAKPPLSNSISWGTVEQQVDAATMGSFNNEAIKLGLMGVTIVVSSGDYGTANVAGANLNCLCGISSGSSDSKWTGSTSWTGTGYFPSFPATSPYVTSVGGTQGPDLGLNPKQEIACQSQSPYNGVITTGGGFSTFYPQPSWQKVAVSQYFAGLSAADTPGAGYNANGRGYPDISMLAVSYQIVVAGSVESVYGTSASAPVLAGYVSLVNAARQKIGKPPIGFLNKMLYDTGRTNGSQYNDVISGSNKCCAQSSGNGSPTCCITGFVSAPGWDPVTGFGSLDYPFFANMFAVSAPYNGSGAYIYTSSPANTTLVFTTIDIVFLFFASLLGFAIIFWTIHLVCCKTRRDPSVMTTTQDQNQAPVPVTSPVSFVRPGHVQPQHVDAYRVGNPDSIIGPPLAVAAHAHPTSLRHPSPSRTFQDSRRSVPTRELQTEEGLKRQKDLMTLVDMGFPFTQSENALDQCNWDLDQALLCLSRTD